MTELSPVAISSSTQRKVTKFSFFFREFTLNLNLIIRKIILHAVGHPVSNTECKIVDTATGQLLGLNQPGELLIRGPQVNRK